jgi:hypothetical protein
VNKLVKDMNKINALVKNCGCGYRINNPEENEGIYDPKFMVKIDICQYHWESEMNYRQGSIENAIRRMKIEKSDNR